jgi:hypothetical protein
VQSFSCWQSAGSEVEGAVAREALQAHFWLPRGASETHTLRTFENGRNRIVAVAQRKLLARPDERLWLSVNDFVTRSLAVCRRDLRVEDGSTPASATAGCRVKHDRSCSIC